MAIRSLQTEATGNGVPTQKRERPTAKLKADKVFDVGSGGGSTPGDSKTGAVDSVQGSYGKGQ